ncbi:hypothetical protein SpCBS45565_g07695 [Spizellomyces sp. 'palustris']|nr:uncharacterized protein SPPG_08994 [Spizellomyces punctatus DAOM BR117]KND03107.1 hypothetical protein SPPG_08994 [Spizellomyces punctatus DAOM BR117]TPX59570.1 hypothetical protein SpCBS45565_g07695 [Spizellomyces sp. 'palustris']|eukprot:XP_016611146.1 hypothetical protein SPPG_08994 [Spizellomyces punctatus DAOM BR117]
MSDDWNPSEDPKPQIEADCAEGHHCHSLKAKLDACTARVEGGDAGEETCVEEFFDLMECVNHCAADKLFAKMK